LVSLEDVKRDPEVDVYVRKGNDYLGVMGYTEHGYRHVGLVSKSARNILEKLGYSKRDSELAAIAGHMHDIGNVISRHDHGQSGAVLAYTILSRMQMDPTEIALVISAIGNHDEEFGHAVNQIAAALILADKSDVHRSRVRNPDFASFDIHDRVNYAVENSVLKVNAPAQTITMELDINQEISTVMDYFEIFLSRLLMCRRAATFLGCTFNLVINGAKLF
jgi:metal-dependent HD superfamily phosphatase/phosphodiesterase